MLGPSYGQYFPCRIRQAFRRVKNLMKSTGAAAFFCLKKSDTLIYAILARTFGPLNFLFDTVN